MSTSINNTIACNEPHANLDVYYGPYDNIDAALEALSDVTIAGVTYHKRHVGLTIGIWNIAKTDITEYWFKGGIGDSNLTEKSSGGGGGGLPGNIKVVTFDKNGATGTQNSVLTDDNSKVCLPQPTIVLSGASFAGWRYGSTTHQAGDSITIGTETVVQAQWSGSQTHKVSWTLGSGITNIQGFDVTANRNINNNAQVEIGHTVRLTATVDSGYTFTNWTGGVTSTNNPVEFSVGGSDITVTANATETKVYRTITWAKGTGITKITGYDVTARTNISNGAQVESGHSIRLTAEVTAGYTFNSWTGDITSSDNPLVFTINSDTTVSATAVQSCILNYTYDGYIDRVSAQYRDSGEPINTGDIVEVGAYVTLEAAPKQNCEFTEWTGLPSGADSTQNPVTFKTVAGTMNIQANGRSVTSECVVDWQFSDGIVGVSCINTATGENVEQRSTVPIGTLIELTAEITDGYTFTEWSGLPGAATSTDNPVTFAIDGNITAIPSAVLTRKYMVKWNVNEHCEIHAYANGVEIENNTGLLENTQVRIEAIPYTGYEFISWRGLPGGQTSTDNPVTFSLTDNATIDVRVGEVPVTVCTVAWTDTDNVTIKGFVNGNPISSGSQWTSGTNVTLEAYPQGVYTFNSWSGLPSGVATDTNPITFVLTQDATNIKANVQGPARTYELNITNGDGVDHSEVTVNGDDKGSVERLEVTPNAEVMIKAFPQSEYTISSWEFVPEITPTAQTEDRVAFIMSDNIEVTVKATKVIEDGFYYYGANTNGNGAKGGVGEDIDPEEGNTKWFTDVEQLVQTKSNSQEIEKNKFNYIYVVCNSESAPTCTYEGLETPIEFVALDNKCGDIDVYNFFAGKWIEENSNKTKGTLKSKGQYIYILIDNELELQSKTITIALSNK